jgi:hypothetical protein
MSAVQLVFIGIGLALEAVLIWAWFNSPPISGDKDK